MRKQEKKNWDCCPACKSSVTGLAKHRLALEDLALDDLMQFAKSQRFSQRQSSDHPRASHASTFRSNLNVCGSRMLGMLQMWCGNEINILNVSKCNIDICVKCLF